MIRPTIRILWVVTSILTCLGIVDSFAGEGQPVALAVAHLDFVDTSGEVKDQKLRHEKQLRLFETELRHALSADGSLKLVPLPCEGDRCSLREPGMDQLIARARTVKARYLLAGGIHKMSTLVGWAKLIVFDLENQGRVCDRLMTYRGDTEEAWRRAAEFSAKNVIRACFR